MSNVDEGGQMDPGAGCMSGGCHTFSKVLSLAGTVYPTAHEPKNCKGVSVRGMNIVITDAAGSTSKVAVNAAGNFYIRGGSIKAPYKVKVVDSAGKERPMVTPLKAGDGNCNSCHTQKGDGAPGRILAPK
jgi:hypothetical protein